VCFIRVNLWRSIATLTRFLEQARKLRALLETLSFEFRRAMPIFRAEEQAYHRVCGPKVLVGPRRWVLQFELEPKFWAKRNWV
jgi:hypothetical protein